MGPTTGIPWKHHLLWGLSLGATVSLCIQILTWVGLGLSHVTWILTYVLVAVFAYLAARSYRDLLGARPGFLRAVLLIAVMILVSRLIYQSYMWVYINFVDPGWVDMVAEFWSAQLAEAGVAEEQIAENIAIFRRQWETDYVFTLGILSFGVAQFVVGIVVALVGVVQPSRRRASSP